ncbi:beta-N-acetylhexosaminidase [Bacillus sp. FJAT-42315]|uniref:beta-N-acetylhexosaminidase n=1 Tax=Bacillus sp. FJAT-42315 TaxID=2014077 RepID=UPI001E4BF800|nr:beta-N-acetylhexosaminidase [Bacillus sp. FJAT-42315]
MFLFTVIVMLLMVNKAQKPEEKPAPAKEVMSEVEEKEIEKEIEKPAIKPNLLKEIEQEKDLDKKAKKIVNTMTLEEKVGQVLMIGFHGTKVSSEVEAMILNKHIGGIIYFDRNMTAPKQVAELSNSLQSLVADSTFQLPLMTAVDQEGGDIVRMRKEVSPLPSQQKLGQTAMANEIYEIAKLNGKELNSMGININFSPVLDLSANDTRSFGVDKNKAYEFGSSVVQGLNASGVTGALKHFPGHGRSNVDPHVETSSVQADQLDLENSDIYPFKQMIQQKDDNNFFVMVTHVKYPAYDKEKPASLSPVIINDLLRKKLGYQGLVVTDDLEMGAVNKYYSYKDMGKEAIQAGADLLLVCHEYSHQLEVYNGLVEAVQKEEISEERINEAAQRIVLHKLMNIKETQVDPEQASSIVKHQEHIQYIQSVVK